MQNGCLDFHNRISYNIIYFLLIVLINIVPAEGKSAVTVVIVSNDHTVYLFFYNENSIILDIINFLGSNVG